MSLNANGWKTTRLGLSLTALTLVLLIALVSVRARRSALGSETNLPVVDNIASSSLTQRRIADFEAELITITPHGLEPQAITRPEGRVLLMVDNQSDLATTSLWLMRDTGARIKEMQVPREQPNWNEAIDLAPGRYVLTESEHPEWQCRITITAR
jgi:hypothetical protein